MRKTPRQTPHWRKSWIDRTINGQVIGERDGWVLFIKDQQDRSEWLNMKLIHMTAKRKRGGMRSCHLGFNGHRLAVNTDTEKMRKLHPELIEWVIECAQENRHGL